MVVNKKNHRPTSNDAYIGRVRSGMHYGNPFSFHGETLATVVVANRRECINAFYDWIMGDAWQEVEPSRRKWIIQHLLALKGKTLVCWCAPLPCHGDVYEELLQHIEEGDEVGQKLLQMMG